MVLIEVCFLVRFVLAGGEHAAADVGLGLASRFQGGEPARWLGAAGSVWRGLPWDRVWRLKGLVVSAAGAGCGCGCGCGCAGGAGVDVAMAVGMAAAAGLGPDLVFLFTLLLWEGLAISDPDLAGRFVMRFDEGPLVSVRDALSLAASFVLLKDKPLLWLCGV